MSASENLALGQNLTLGREAEEDRKTAQPRCCASGRVNTSVPHYHRNREDVLQCRYSSSQAPGNSFLLTWHSDVTTHLTRGIYLCCGWSLWQDKTIQEKLLGTDVLEFNKFLTEIWHSDSNFKQQKNDFFSWNIVERWLILQSKVRSSSSSSSSLPLLSSSMLRVQIRQLTLHLV